MTYTFLPTQPHAKALGHNMRISRKSAVIICAAIRNKPLNRAKRLLVDLKGKKRNLRGKYYSKTVEGILQLLESCEKNAGNLGLDAGRLFVHASAHQGTMLRRRRRKAAFGSQLKATNVEVLLIERGKISEERRKEKLKEQVKETVKKEVQKMKEREAVIVEDEKQAEEQMEKREKPETPEISDFEEEVEKLKERERKIEEEAEDMETKVKKKGKKQ